MWRVKLYDRDGQAERVEVYVSNIWRMPVEVITWGGLYFQLCDGRYRQVNGVIGRTHAEMEAATGAKIDAAKVPEWQP